MASSLSLFSRSLSLLFLLLPLLLLPALAHADDSQTELTGDALVPPEHPPLSADEQAFLKAAEEGDLESVKRLVESLGEKHRDLKNDMSDNALFAAASNNSLDVVKHLVENLGYEVNDKDMDGATPTHIAAWHGHKDVVAYLLAHGGELDAVCDNGWTPLLGAARWGELEMVEYLHGLGATLNPTTRDGVYNALMIAAMHGNTNVVEYMLEKGVDPNARDAHGRTALQLARENGYIETVKVLENKMNYGEL